MIRVSKKVLEQRFNNPSVQLVGFTLIELIIAIGLSLIIIIAAVSAFRMATKTMTLMNRLSLENGMLRSGYSMAMDDVDFWNTAANPDFPYLKGQMSDEVEIAGDSGNNVYNKRIFKPVTFVDDENLNPNWDQPNDRRSWYRNGIIQGPRPFGYNRSPSGSTTPRFVYWNDRADDSAGMGGPDYSGIISSHAGKWWPTGWEPWHIYGDYSIVSNLVMEPLEGKPNTIAKETWLSHSNNYDGVRAARPRLMWDLFKTLGHVGVYSYMPPGTINIMVRPSTNNIVENIGIAKNHYDMGEIPWSLTHPVESALDWPMRNILGRDYFGTPTFYDLGTVDNPDKTLFPDNQLGNYFIGMPGKNGQMALDNTNYTYHGTFFHGARTGAEQPHWLADMEEVNGDWGGNWAIAVLIGTKFASTNAAGSAFSDTPNINYTTRDPYRLLDLYYNYDFSSKVGTPYWQQDRDYRSRTVFFPRNYTDATNPDMSDVPTGVPSLSSSIFRYRFKGADKSLCRIDLQDQSQGKSIQIGFMAIGTTLRGARQHWGWKTHFDQPAMKPMGDLYMPGKP